MIEIELDILWNTQETQNKILAGIESELKDCVIKRHTFYLIAHIRPFDEQFCEVVSDGQIYIVNEPYESVQAKIRERLLFKWN
ncbi:hypothetical protein [Flavobacterium sp.]|uniref:hypothetical protein n=1 Tax=Flavobacterium sp. TaxID=239 RepID=UPI003D6BA96D